MANTVLMACAAAMFVGFWAYLAWDAHKEVLRAEAQDQKKSRKKHSR